MRNLTILLLFPVLLIACSVSEADQVTRGHTLYVQTCQRCHGDAATGDAALTGTPVHSVAGHTWYHPDGQLEDIILGRFVYPNRQMPVYAGQLSRSDVQAILAYLKSNWPQEQRDHQAEVSRQQK